ncbi:MAG: hypothetical protein ACI8PT_001219 [Gammaproteobacteria bacterium]|jgi:hypothetical protein
MHEIACMEHLSEQPGAVLPLLFGRSEQVAHFGEVAIATRRPRVVFVPAPACELPVALVHRLALIERPRVSARYTRVRLPGRLVAVESHVWPQTGKRRQTAGVAESGSPLWDAINGPTESASQWRARYGASRVSDQSEHRTASPADIVQTLARHGALISWWVDATGRSLVPDLDLLCAQLAQLPDELAGRNVMFFVLTDDERGVEALVSRTQSGVALTTLPTLGPPTVADVEPWGRHLRELWPHLLSDVDLPWVEALVHIALNNRSHPSVRDAGLAGGTTSTLPGGLGTPLASPSMRELYPVIRQAVMSRRAL